MRTVTQLKKLPSSELSDAIAIDVRKCRKLRETELNTDYLEKHPGVSELPQFIIETNEHLAMYYVQGSLETLLWFAIQKLQTAEAVIESMKV